MNSPQAPTLTRPAGDILRLVGGELPPAGARTVSQYLEALLGQQDFAAAGQFLAHALPKREAVWWACRCARLGLPANAPPAIVAALQAAEEWVVTSGDDQRRAAGAAAEAAGYGTPAGCAALAAFLSGGSLAPPNLTAVPPPEHAAATAVAGAVTLAAVAPPPDKAPERYRKFFALGVAVGAGQDRWPDRS